MVMAKLDRTNCFPVIFNCYFFLVLLSDFQKAHINEGLKEYLAFHFIDSDGQFDGESVFADDLDDFCFVFEFFAFVFDLGGGG